MSAHHLDHMPVTAGDHGLDDYERQVIRNAAARLHGIPAVYELTPERRANVDALDADAAEAEARFLDDPTVANEQRLFRAVVKLAQARGIL